MIAALFVAADGPYALMPDVEIWTERDTQQALGAAPVHADARMYAGPHRVVAHPPCERWGRYWHGGPSGAKRLSKGDDAGCFASALTYVRLYGGVLEHPEGSAAWPHFGLTRPLKSGGWIEADRFGAWTCCVEQGHYGHRARKATWLYLVGEPCPLVWGPAAGKARLDVGFHTSEERTAGKAAGLHLTRGEARLSARECWETPPAFRDLLLTMARG